ncbi:MAG: sulfite exporter TauE/SafE family protein [Burkholderiaceae bacterium]
MNFTIITDPFFYAVAVPAVLLMGISKSGFGAGFGSMAVPLLALAVTVPQAAAILMPVLLLVDLMGLAVFRKQFDRALLKFLLPYGLLGTLIGALSFKFLDSHIVAGIVGFCTLLFLAQRLVFPPRADSYNPPRWLGMVLTTTSGFTSFVAHAGAPPLSAYVIPMRLAPVTFAASMSIYFFSINLAKWVPYAWLGLFAGPTLWTSLVLLPIAPFGVWLGLRLTKRMSPALFYRLVYLGMFVTGSKLLWDALG